MYRYRNRCTVDPRGRANGHRGFRSDVFPGIIALIFFGWIILAALGGMIGAGVMVLGSVFSRLGRIVPGAVRRLLSGEGFALGVALGLVWYFRTHRRNEQETQRAEETRSGGAIDETPVQAEIAEAPVYRTYGA